MKAPDTKDVFIFLTLKTFPIGLFQKLPVRFSNRHDGPSHLIDVQDQEYNVVEANVALGRTRRKLGRVNVNRFDALRVALFHKARL